MSAPIVEDALRRQLPESEKLDFKQTSYSDAKEWLKDVSAFANASGGRLILGVGQDEHGRARDAIGIKGTLDTEPQRLRNWLRDQTEPDLSPYVKITGETDSAGRNYLIVDIQESPQKPHRLELPGDKYQRQVYVRDGTDNIPASMQAITAIAVDATTSSAKAQAFIDNRQRNLATVNPLHNSMLLASIAFHIAPRRGFGSHAFAEWAIANKGTPLGDTNYVSWSTIKPDAEGAYSVSNDKEDPSYHRVFYNGVAELVYTDVLYQSGEDDDTDKEQVVPAARIRYYAERHLGRMLQLMQQATGVDQFEVSVSLHGLADVRLHWKSRGWPEFSQSSPNEDLIQLHSVPLQATGDPVKDVEPLLKIVFRAWGEHEPPTERLSRG